MAASKDKRGSNKITERAVRDALKSRIGGMPEVLTPTGSIDLLTITEVIEVKHYRNWKEGIGQVVAYGSHYLSRTKRLHLFAQIEGDTRASKYVELAESVCSTYGIHVTFEEVMNDTDGGAVFVAGAALASGAAPVAAGGATSGVGRASVAAAATAAAATAIVAGAAVSRRGPIEPGSRGPYKKVPRTTTQDERDGLQAMVAAIGEAFQRAKARGSEDAVYHYMSLPRYRASKLTLVRFLQENDNEYHPGEWFTGSSHFKTKNTLGFKNLVALVQAQVTGFDWGSWYQE